MSDAGLAMTQIRIVRYAGPMIDPRRLSRIVGRVEGARVGVYSPDRRLGDPGVGSPGPRTWRTHQPDVRS